MSYATNTNSLPMYHTEGTMMHKPTIGQKLKGTVKEISGAITRNPMKKEQGRLLRRGIQPTTSSAYM
jgi:hypothetical protein